MSKPNSGRKSIAVNRKARHEYEVLDKLEVGIELRGSEVKSLRAGKLNFADSFAAVENNEVWLHHLHIEEYPQANQFNHVPTRKRRLLLHRHQIERFRGKIKEQGLTLVPIELYFSGSTIKLELALARGKKTHDKREALKEKAAKRDMARGR